MSLEFSKSAQVALMSSIGIEHPASITFNDVEALMKYETSLKFPMLLKPEQGGSGARIYIINELDELRQLLKEQPELWLPDNLLLLQERLFYKEDFGIIRVEFIGGKMLYAMRVITHGVFNLCPSVVCNPENGEQSHCQVVAIDKKPEFYPYPEISTETIAKAQRIVTATGHDTCSVEYLETTDGRTVFYDINSNSNLRASIGKKFGIEPFKVVADYLLACSKENIKK